MIKRVWHGWVKSEQAEAYEHMLRGDILPEIGAKRIPGHLDTRLLKRRHEEETEYVVVMTFDALASVRNFVGDDPSVAYVPERAKRLLSRWDERVALYDNLDYSAY